MRRLTICIHLLLLITTPTALLYPQTTLQVPSSATKQMPPSLTYDQIMDLLSDLESGQLEKKYNPEDIERINYFLALLAHEGGFEDDFGLEEDIEELLEKESPLEYAPLSMDGEYIIIPSIPNDSRDIHLCKGWVSKKWKKTKRFVKKHKKEIIIGAVIVVAVTVVVVAVVAASSATATSAAVGAAGAASSKSNKAESPKSEKSISSPVEIPHTIDAMDEAQILKAAIDEHVSLFKEFVEEDSLTYQIDLSEIEEQHSFGEKIRELGAFLAHETLDGVSELASFVPEVSEEIREIGTQFLPDSLIPPNIENPEIMPLENYEDLFSKGHEAIDRVFATDQAEIFTAEARANDSMNNFAIGFLPPPGAIFKTFSDTSKFVRAGKAFDRAGYTKAGRNLMKHGYREGSVFPKPLGSPAQVNVHGQQVLESIVNHPERVIYERPHPDFGKVIEIVVPDKWGARFTMEAEMIGFLEP